MVSGRATEVPLLAIAGAACWCCDTEPVEQTPLKKCNGCLRAYYCSRECQVRDWKGGHKGQCQALQQVNRVCAEPPEEAKPCQGMPWEGYVEMQLFRLGMAMRVMPGHENDPIWRNITKVVQHQGRCDNCHLTPFDSDGPLVVRLTPCPHCKITFWCSQTYQHKSLDHADRCAELGEIAVLDKMAYTWDKNNTKPFMLPGVNNSKVYAAPSTFKSWSDVYQVFEDPLTRTPPANHCSTITCEKTPDELLNIKHASKTGSTIMTIFAGLGETIPDLATRSSLVIHIIGAAIDELLIITLNEDLLHICPDLRMLTVGYIGPGVPSEVGTGCTVEQRVCLECESNGRTHTVFYHHGLYHDFVVTNRAKRNPADLLVAFNSGHTAGKSFVESWAPTLKYILTSNIPAVLTTFSQMEADKEEAAFNEMGANFVVRPHINKWQSLVGNPVVVVPKHQMRYKNYFWYIVKGYQIGSQQSATRD